MKTAVLLLGFILLSAANCEEGESEREQEQAALNAKFSELKQLTDIPCVNSSDWNFAAVGSKACGGPALYMAYPLEEETQFLSTAAVYTQMQQNFNTKWGIVSDCMMVASPQSVSCIDGQPELIY